MIVNHKWLFERLGQPELVIVDCRFTLGPGASENGHEAYRNDHVPGAYYLHLERDMSGTKSEHGGRHPLPELTTLADKLSEIGIVPGVCVVAYDDQGGAMASRLWWLLKYIGFDGTVHVLDEGYTKWKQAGYPITSEVLPKQAEGRLPVKVRPELLLGMEEVRARLGKSDVLLLDSREEPRYRGQAEHIDPVAGHIPGAHNLFWKSNLDAEGKWKPLKEQQARFERLQRASEIVVYCGSGITACPNVLALEEAGFTNVKLYAGSWSDWISYEGNPVEKG